MNVSLTRRDFLRGAAAAAPLVSLPRLFAGPAERRRASKYIDVHTHIGTTWNGNQELTPKQLLDWMDAQDVERAVLLPLVSPESSSYLLLKCRESA